MAAPSVPAAPFSYAQAARGMTSSATSNQSSRVPSGTITPAKEVSSPVPLDNSADDIANHKTKDAELSSSQQETHRPRHHARTGTDSKPRVNGTSANGTNPPSPDFVSSSASTLAREDDIASLPNESSESTWEDNKSQTSHPEKLHEAPKPAVNVWQQRMEKQRQDAGASAKPKQPTGLALNGVASSLSTNVSIEEPKETGNQRRRDNDAVKNQKHKDDDTSRGRKLAKPAQPAVAPPSISNEELWPTPELAQEEERKKPLDKSEKTDKPEKTPIAKNTKWNKIEVNHSVVFNTPLPTNHSRRGGRGGARGGREGGSKSGQNGSIEKGAQGGQSAGEHIRREKSEAGPRSSSPKGKRAASSEGPSKAGTAAKESTKEVGSRDSRPAPRAAQESASAAQGQHNTFPRQSGSQFKSNGRRQDRSPGSDWKGDVKSPDATQPSVKEDALSPSTVPTMNGGEELKSIPTFESGLPKQTQDRRPGLQQFPTRDRGDNRRGSVRGGRNGAHGFHPGPISTNGQPPFPNGNYSLPRSPTVSQEAYYNQGPHGTHRSYRGTPRAQSIAVDGGYSRYVNGYPGVNNLPPLHTAFLPPSTPMYDYQGGQSLSAFPYHTGFVESVNISGMLQTQLEYYFGTDNLIKDWFLRQNMDSQGFVLVDLIMGFSRIKNLSQDVGLIKFAASQSPRLELRTGNDGQDRIRRREGWDSWVLEISQRLPAAQNHGPESFTFAPIPHPPLLDPSFFQSPPRQNHTLPPTSLASPTNLQMPNGQPFYQQEEGRDAPLQPTASSFQVSPSQLASPRSPDLIPSTLQLASPAPTADPALNGTGYPEADAFSDAEVEKLNVMTRAPRTPGPYSPPSQVPHHALSNGSLDGHISSLNGVAPEPVVNGTGAASSHESEGHKSPKPSDLLSPDFGLPGLRNLSRSGLSDNSVSFSRDSHTFWIQGQESPARELPDNVSSQLYTDVRANALEQRAQAPVGTCPQDMVVLYQFWSHFLVRNFNTRMYQQFRQLAEEDEVERMTCVGKQHLVRYFNSALLHESPIRDVIIRDILSSIKTELSEESLERTILKSLRAAYRNGALNLRTRRKIRVYADTALLDVLDA